MFTGFLLFGLHRSTPDYSFFPGVIQGVLQVYKKTPAN